MKPAAASSRQFKTSCSRFPGPPENYTPQRKEKQELVPEAESDHESIATYSTRTPRKTYHALWVMLRCFSRQQHAKEEITRWREGKANEVMEEAGAFSCKKILADDLRKRVGPFDFSSFSAPLILTLSDTHFVRRRTNCKSRLTS